MTEIPEHLLQRSRERRAAMGGGDGDASGGDGTEATAGATATPAKAAAPVAKSTPAHPAPEEKPPPPPPSPMVEAYNRRRRIPMWAMPMLAALPLWAYIFVGTLSPPPSGAEGPGTVGAEIYGTNCASCHGGGGGGGAGPAFTDGAVYVTFPSFLDQVEWVRLGSSGWLGEHGDTYGANDKPVQGGMPGFSSFSDEELLMVVYHERTAFGGENPDPDDAALLEAAAEYSLENPEATIDEVLAAVGNP